MTLLRIIQDAVSSAKKVIIENLDTATERTGDLNPYGDKTLLLDVKAEDAIISVLSSSGTDFEILTEEKGFIKSEKTPEYLALIDPIDGSANLERGIPLVSIGISIVPYRDVMTSDDAEISVIDSVFTDENYVAVTGSGVTRNGVRVSPSAPVELRDAIISYDTKRTWDPDFMERSLRTISAVHDTRRSASNLLDLCWTASGYLDGMVDLRDMLPIIHLCGTHMVFEAGGFVLGHNGNRFHSSLEPEKMMNFVAASNETLARQILDSFNGS
ncbi:MAG: inositol monophosphatase family protein [Candidatus Thorarchaeota archaeon]|jgi:myo-inositol-1(or 4)-monophosphatase